jgi:hypothetical protein
VAADRRRKIVQVIYATGEPGYLDFAIVEQRRAVPGGARVFAICKGDRVVSELDEMLFAAISDVDYYNYMAVLREALEREKRRLRERHPATIVRRFLNWLSGPSSVKKGAVHQTGG